MSPAATDPAAVRRAWLTPDDVDLDDFRQLLADGAATPAPAHAGTVESGVPVYDGERLRALPPTGPERRAVLAELAEVLADGAGVLAVRGAFDDPDVVDRATEVFDTLIAEQREQSGEAADHFAPPGANDRVWNAAEKLAVRAPEVFAAYYANEALALVCHAWLGPGYQVTSQVNVVNPHGGAQHPHRDYHLGFLTDEQAARFPAHVHRLSPVLTLQGAVAHVDMPLESGPTLYLPHSQKYLPGYLAWRRPDFAEHFARHHVQLPLAKGDAVFFNPALHHAAGRNSSAHIRRTANLLQVSSAFGRAMETVDRVRMAEALLPALIALDADGDHRAVHHVVAAAAEGYAFPTDLDSDPPTGGLAPATQADLLHRAVAERWTATALRRHLTDWTARRGGNRQELP